jgi:CrcB protein
MIGILGGFTTFSTFAYETLALAQDAEFFRAMLNTVLQVVLGFAAAFIGFAAARSL